jgi:hypothetical protein
VLSSTLSRERMVLLLIVVDRGKHSRLQQWQNICKEKKIILNIKRAMQAYKAISFLSRYKNNNLISHSTDLNK